ncbi:helix-turn-helix domain-containing protein [Paenibacillus xylanilyticus]|uniref:helix-turn-helix domain-containing protein n=1 Tax=Paenibacillus xylanilyticus TaxID=248903 RepID=UPI0039A0E3BA
MAEKHADYAIHETRPFGILIAGHYEEKKGYEIHRPSGSIDWLLMYTLSGEGVIQHGKNSISCTSGDVAILLPGLPHHYETKQEHWEFIWVHFIPDPNWSTWLKLPEMSDRFFFQQIASEELQHDVHNALQRLVRHGRSEGSSELHRRLAELALEETLIRIQQTFPPDVPATMDPRIAEMMRHLQMYPAQKVSIPELASRCCLSTSRLSHLFKEQVGDTILNTVHKFRLEKAAQLLNGTNRQIAEIATDVGFDCGIHFTRKFREAFGETPSAFRKRKNSPQQ